MFKSLSRIGVLLVLLVISFMTTSATFAQDNTTCEVVSLKVECAKTAATMWLKLLREGDVFYGNCIDNIQMRLEEGGLTLEDIGTTEAEIATLQVTGAKMAATKLLVLIRDTISEYDEYRDRLQEELTTGGLTLDDIGATQAEIGKCPP